MLVLDNTFMCSPQWISFPNNMGFPCSLAADEMTLYILDNFEWYCREVVLPTEPLPYGYGELCPDFGLTVAEVRSNLRGPRIYIGGIRGDATK